MGLDVSHTTGREDGCGGSGIVCNIPNDCNGCNTVIL